jgi:hypothetical protein
MKRLIVADKNGRIIATAPHPDEIPGIKGKFGFVPLKGQYVHEVDLPEHIKTPDHLQQIHTTYVVQVEGKRATLVAK